MITVNVNTQELSREAIPAYLKGLDVHTLNNLQAELNPVPLNLTDIEYWNEVGQATVYDSETQKLGNEILTIDVINRVVNITHEVVELIAQEIQDNLNTAKASKITSLESKALKVQLEDLTAGGVTFTTDAESISEITSSLSIMGRNPTETIDFKGKSGWAVANKAALEAMQDAVWAKRKSTNANEKLHDDAINALTTVQAVNDYDIATGW